MGLKIAVVGGGSTYTPELVEGFARRAAVLPDRRARAARPRRRASRGRRRARRADPAPRRLAGPAGPHRRPLGGARRRRLHADPAARRRAGGAARRRDAPPPVRRDRPGDDGAGRVRQGPAHGAARPRHRRGVRPPGRAGRLDPRLHQPGRDRDPGAARRRAIGRSACATSRSASSARSPTHFGVAPERVAARPRRAQPPVLDPRASPWTASTGCRSCSPRATRS